MMFNGVRVVYPDGREEIVKVTPRVKIECEKQYKGMRHEIATEGSYWMAWYQLKKAGKTSVGFDAWIDHEIEECFRIDYDPVDLRSQIESLIERHAETVPVEELLAVLEDDADPTQPEASSDGESG